MTCYLYKISPLRDAVSKCENLDEMKHYVFHLEEQIKELNDQQWKNNLKMANELQTLDFKKANKWF